MKALTNEDYVNAIRGMVFIYNLKRIFTKPPAIKISHFGYDDFRMGFIIDTIKDRLYLVDLKKDRILSMVDCDVTINADIGNKNLLFFKDSFVMLEDNPILLGMDKKIRLVYGDFYMYPDKVEFHLVVDAVDADIVDYDLKFTYRNWSVCHS